MSTVTKKKKLYAVTYISKKQSSMLKLTVPVLLSQLKAKTHNVKLNYYALYQCMAYAQKLDYLAPLIQYFVFEYCNIWSL